MVEFSFKFVVEFLVIGDDPLAQLRGHLRNRLGARGNLLGDVFGYGLPLLTSSGRALRLLYDRWRWGRGRWSQIAALCHLPALLQKHFDLAGRPGLRLGLRGSLGLRPFSGAP